MGVLTHNLSMQYDSWHARLYRYWVSLGGKPSPGRENLCRYMRVLFIYAPSRWFFKGRIKTYVPPWTVALLGAFLAFVGVAFYLWPNISLEVLWKAGAVVGCLGAGLALILGIVYLYDRDPQTTKTIAKWATSPIWIIPALIVLAGIWIWDHLEEEFRAFGKFLERRVFFGVHPFAALSVLWALALVAIGFYQNPIKTGIVVGSIVFIACLIIGGILLVEWLDERRDERRSHVRPGRLRRTYDGVADTVKLGTTYASTKKRGSRVCPFIDFERSSTTT